MKQSTSVTVKRDKQKPRKRKGQSTSRKAIEAIQHEAQALNLRLEGKTFTEIAAAVGYKDRSGAHHAVMRALDRLVDEPTEQMRNLELKRLDALVRAMWPAATRADPDAVDRVLKIMARRARLMGLDMPEKHDHTVKGDMTVSRNYDRLQELLKDERFRDLAGVVISELG